MKIRAGYDRDASDQEMAAYRHKLGFADYELACVEEGRLVPKAERWGIEIRPEDWIQLFGNSGPGYLNGKARTRIRKGINEERRRVVKEWAEIVLPFSGFILAALAIVF